MTDVAESPGRVKAFLRLVAIEHSVFALPFAYLSALVAMAVDGSGVHWVDLLLVTVAMVAGRTFAMAANRILDRRIDALNPRTRNRELVTGAVSVRTAWTGALVSLALLFLAAGLLNPLCLLLSPLAVVPLVIYPYAKRFTSFPHYVLALAQSVAPVGAWLAITGTFAGSGPAWVLGAAVGLWIGGFDIIYACQDVEVDRRIGVHSTPARFGVRVALHVSTATHVVTFALFVWFGVLAGLGWLWWIGLLLTAAAFGYQHIVVTPADLSKVNRAFFTANGFVGIALFLFAVLDLAVQARLG
ncbi:4-hydroxybenzoate octaprenyltransferase [Mangrovihabitans endophyticus]|uniref:4-hydroxybenzoate polyprenyltransferase n=1 Tax=Mangrovihabitans endophyticus TaxID=1751298 RepID=A0A8J3C1P2_9ACTN|nr:menaquinone biosynthesis prenyltransferase MqnP [Mangrovihabitans endophyticus]GGK97264.1 4-hydroxybenzoate octaprenyltransferase [Mangrovihabitans endophyticus]